MSDMGKPMKLGVAAPGEDGLKSLARMESSFSSQLSVWIESYEDVLGSWVTMFDPGTSPKVKSILETSFDESFARAAAAKAHFGETNGTAFPANAGILPKGTLLVPILIEAFDIGAKAFSSLHSKGIVDDFALGSYSSGLHHLDLYGNPKSEKRFADGTSMSGYVWITEQHLAKIIEAEAILLVDIAFETGLTLRVFGESLKAAGYAGKIYQYARFNHSGLNEWDGSVKPWDGVLYRTRQYNEAVQKPKVAPIFTERSNSLTFQGEPRRILKV